MKFVAKVSTSKRHATRLMSDAYGRGIVRGQSENTNLRANGKSNDVCAEKSFRTCGTTSFFPTEYFDMVERPIKSNADARAAVFGEVDSRNPRKKKVVMRNVAVLVGERPQQLQYLSPYLYM